MNTFRLKPVFNVLARGRKLLAATQVHNSFLIQPIRCFGQPASQTHPHLIQEGEVTPGISKAEYQSRRYQLTQKIAEHSQIGSAKNHIVIIPSAPKTYMTNDIPYVFRQNTDFLYLSGFQEPDSVLILETHSDKFPEHKATLFVPKRDPHRELWDGPRSGIHGAVELTGVDAAENNDQLTPFLESYLKSNKGFVTWYDYNKPPHLEFHLKAFGEFVRQNRYGFTETPRGLLQALRVIKSPAEIKLMQGTCDIAAEAFKEVMKYSYTGINESHLYAKMDFECRINGAEYLAYPPVVAGGDRANIIHYVSNNQLINQGEMVLMDAGCEYHGYTSDITRTWPVTGEYTDAQRVIYEAVQEVQEECMKMCGETDVSLEMIYRHMLKHIGSQLQSIGIIPCGWEEQKIMKAARVFCPHHVGHYLGMDVHDTDEVSRNSTLQPGMAITIEPGIYIPKTRTDVPSDFRGIGIRIEDDFVITKGGALNLSVKCPKDPDEIEKLINTHS